MFLASRRGKRVLNFMYSWGAAIVVIGALFKLLHLPYENQLLFIGMITEFLVFFISGFEQPEEEYRWEQVFPELDSFNPLDREEIALRRQSLAEKANRSRDMIATDHTTSLSHDTLSITPTAPGDVERLANSIDQLSKAAEQLSRLGALSESMSQQWEAMQIDTSSMELDTKKYHEQLQVLSKNIQGLNTIYEIQLKGISSQIDTIDHINNGLQRIRTMYDSTVIDSSTFQEENQKMASQLSELNAVYARILKALTVNMGQGVMDKPNI